MYPHPWGELPSFVAHDWPQYRGEKTLVDVAESVIEAFHIEDGDSLVGSSLGGMVGCEIARIRRIPDLYLVGSALHPDEIVLFARVAYPAINIVPLRHLSNLAKRVPHLLAEMFSAADKDFIRQMCHAVFGWEGFRKSSSRVHRLHGSLDVVITPPAKADLIVPGGHLISISHAQECADYILANQHVEPTASSVPLEI